MSHENNGRCEKCQIIFDLYPGFHKGLRVWFELFQQKNPEAHISCAGRGRLAQETCVLNKTSKAHWGHSAHNYNCAIDIFEMGGDPKSIYENKWFYDKVKPAIDAAPWLEWYGKPDAEFREVPHIEIKLWRELLKEGLVSLVE